MLETILQWDLTIFEFINQTFTNGFFDWFLPIMRYKYVWVPLYIFLISFLVINYRGSGIVLCLFAFLTIALTDQTSSSLVKHFFERLRPCNDPDVQDQMRLLVDCGSGFSFTSSHATNHFGLAAFLAALFNKNYRWVGIVFYIWAFVVSYSQVYVGVHYPFDILGGAILGTIIGKTTGTTGRFLTNFDP